MRDAVIIDAVRTPIGKAFKGSLTEVRADDLGGHVLRELFSRNPAIDGASVDDVICGTAHEVGEQGMNLGRVVGALGGLPASVSGTTVNRFCASSLQALCMAFHAIRSGEGDVFVAAGVESVSRTSGRDFLPDDENPRFTDPARDDYVNDLYISMGLTAENVAAEFGIGRERMDDFAVQSQARAVRAQESGVFDREIVPVPLPNGSEFRVDDCPRPGVTLDGLANLRPVFKDDGRVTAGNACPLNDGAAAVLVTSDDHARAAGATPRARIIASAVSGLEPERMGVGPIDAVRRVLGRASMTIDDVDIVELNEAFAAQVLPVCDVLGIDTADQLNPYGGAIALGHPFGMTGARLVATLLTGLEARDQSVGLVTMCVGGGQGMAMLIERMTP